MNELSNGVIFKTNIFDDCVVFTILGFDQCVKQNMELDLEQIIDLHDGRIIISWIRNLKNEVEHHRLLDMVVVCLMNGIDKELSSELKRSFEL